MNCPKCGAVTQAEQNYCGDCGRRLQNVCPGCGAANSPLFNFCGQCGKSLAAVGDVVLDRSGLILEADPIALSLLSLKPGAMGKKPFSLFVEPDDLVVFYSHWNELIRTSERQILEIGLRPSQGPNLHAQVELRSSDDGDSRGKRIHLGITDVSDRRHALNTLQDKQDLINLIFSLAEEVGAALSIHQERIIRSALEKVCLFADAQRGFICRIDMTKKRLNTVYQWDQPSAPGSGGPSGPFSLDHAQRILTKLHRERTYVVNDINKRITHERKELADWQGNDMTAYICHLLNRRKKPFGILGVASRNPVTWPDDTIALVRYAGGLLTDILPFSVTSPSIAASPAIEIDSGTRRNREENPIIDLSTAEIITGASEPPGASGSELPLSFEKNKKNEDANRRMHFETDLPENMSGRQRVFAREDGMFWLTCPECGFQEAAAPDLFQALGFALRVTCPCSHLFSIMREQRTAYRKTVRLDGFFSQAPETDRRDKNTGMWGPMVVKNLSKTGLEFSSTKSSRIHPGERLSLRFTLDNTSQTLIKKTARVKSADGGVVRCQFEGSDRYDITLGFYFL